MKTLLTIIVAIFALSAFPQTAEAGNNRRYAHKCGTCHQPVYSYRSVYGYDNYGSPLYRWVLHRHHHRTSYRSHYRKPYYGGGYYRGGGGYYRRGYRGGSCRY